MLFARLNQATPFSLEHCMTYLLIKTLHLLAAMAFIGTLFFQVLILAPAGRRLDASVRGPMSQALGQQARRVIHWVALVLYGATPRSAQDRKSTRLNSS